MKLRFLAHQVSIKAPDFMETSVDGWFTIIESQFHLRGVVSSTTKFYHTISALPAEIVSRLPTSVINSRSYDDFKVEILAMYERSKPEMLNKLMETTCIHGRPSVALQEMMALAQKLKVSDDIVRYKFLQKLSPSLSTVLALQRDMSLTALGKLAEELTPYLSTNSTSAYNVVAPIDAVQEQRQQKQKCATNERIPWGLRPFRDEQRPKICRAHIYFAARARNCKPWCMWPDKSGC